MGNRHGLVLVRRVELDLAAQPRDEILTRLSRAVARVRRRLDDVSAACRAEPGTWGGAELEDVTATLDWVADVAACEADRLRAFADANSVR
ncbi:MAG: hypothetical protein ACREP0_10880 [Rhodanobacteraceae bacterium]